MHRNGSRSHLSLDSFWLSFALHYDYTGSGIPGAFSDHVDNMRCWWSALLAIKQNDNKYNIYKQTKWIGSDKVITFATLYGECSLLYQNFLMPPNGRLFGTKKKIQYTEKPMTFFRHQLSFNSGACEIFGLEIYNLHIALQGKLAYCLNARGPSVIFFLIKLMAEHGWTWLNILHVPLTNPDEKLMWRKNIVMGPWATRVLEFPVYKFVNKLIFHYHMRGFHLETEFTLVYMCRKWKMKMKWMLLPPGLSIDEDFLNYNIFLNIAPIRKYKPNDLNLLRGHANSDFNNLETSKFENPQFWHILLYCPYLV